MRLDRTFAFRGSRDYLHSTTVFADLVDLRGGDVTGIDMKFHRRTARQVSYTDDPRAADGAVAEWRDDRGRLYIVERGAGIEDRAPYDEAALERMLGIDGRVVRIPAETPGFTRFEGMVAGFKLLLNAVDAGAPRKYVFVRVRLAHSPQGTMQIHYARDIGSFFQGDVSEAGNPVGQIFFGVW